MPAPVNPSTGKPFASGDKITPGNSSAWNDYQGWQQNQQINSWNQAATQNAAARQQMTAPRPAQAQQSQQQPQQASPSLSYQTGFNANSQAVNSGNVIGRMQAESQYKPTGLSKDGARAVADQQRSMSMNDAAQLRRGMEAQNSQQFLKNQVARSQLMQQGMANQAKMYEQIAQRDISQIGLAEQIQEAQIRARSALAQALMSTQT